MSSISPPLLLQIPFPIYSAANTASYSHYYTTILPLYQIITAHITLGLPYEFKYPGAILSSTDILNHQMVVLDLHKRSIHTILSIPVFIQAPVKAYHEGGLKKIHLSYTTMPASPEGLTAHKGPLPLSLSILVLIYCLYFTQEPSSK